MTAINLQTLSDVEIELGDKISIPLDATDLVSIKRKSPTFCGPFDFKMFPSLKFVSISDSTLTIKPKSVE